MSIKSSETGTWDGLVSELTTKRAELAAAESALSDSTEMLGRATSGAYAAAKDANQSLGVDIHSQTPSKEERDQLRAVIGARLSPEGRRRIAIDAGAASALSSHLKVMDDAERALTTEQANHGGLESTVHNLVDVLAKLESEQPKATAQALAAIDSQIADIEQELNQVIALMAEYSAITDGAADEATASAQARLDEVAALEALGINSAEDKKTAQTELAKAKAAAQKALDAANQRAAALRGLERKGQELEEQIEGRRNIRGHVARLLHGEQLSELEHQLVAHIQSDKLKGLMIDIRKAAAALSSVSPDSVYHVGSLEIKMPRLYMDPNRDALSMEKIQL